MEKKLPTKKTTKNGYRAIVLAIPEYYSDSWTDLVKSAKRFIEHLKTANKKPTRLIVYRYSWRNDDPQLGFDGSLDALIPKNCWKNTRRIDGGDYRLGQTMKRSFDEVNKIVG